jgi:hypothetical protein
MSFLVHVLVVLVILGFLGLVAAAVGFFVVRRFLRRRWRGVQTHVATRGVVGALALVAGWHERVNARRTPEELSQGTASRVRRKMWVAIEDAEATVLHADAIDAPVAELPAVCRSLRRVGGELDNLLRLERRLPLAQGRPDSVRAQVAEVIRAAREVQSAALRASGDAREPQLRELVRRAQSEVEMVALAVDRMRSMSQPRP